MKNLILLLLFSLSSSLLAKTCEFTWENKPKDSNYKLLYTKPNRSHKTNASLHSTNLRAMLLLELFSFGSP